MELIREMTACFTGHRMIGAERESAVMQRTERIVRLLIAQGYDTFLAGGALGFDTLAQRIVLRLREELPHIRLVMAIPCADQDARWREDDRLIYREMKRMADECIVLSPVYTSGCMLARNRFMVDNSSVCIACYNGSPRGGTAYTVRYASREGIRMFNAWQ